MSDDLISRKVLFDELSSLRIKLNGISCRKEFKKTVKEVLDCVKHIVEDQPTAFDKEKVIEQIKVLSAGIILNTNISDDYAEGYVRAAKDIIEIIKKGGIE